MGLELRNMSEVISHKQSETFDNSSELSECSVEESGLEPNSEGESEYESADSEHGDHRLRRRRREASDADEVIHEESFSEEERTQGDGEESSIVTEKNLD